METFPIDKTLEWQIRFHQAMASVLRVHEQVKNQVGFLGIVSRLWKTSRDLTAVVTAVKQLTEAPDGAVDPQFIDAQIPQVTKLLRSIESLYDTSERKGLTNRRLSGGALESIRAKTEYIADYLDTLDMSIDPSVLAAIQEGRGQIQRGDFEVMERLF